MVSGRSEKRVRGNGYVRGGAEAVGRGGSEDERGWAEACLRGSGAPGGCCRRTLGRALLPQAAVKSEEPMKEGDGWRVNSKWVAGTKVAALVSGLHAHMAGGLRARGAAGMQGSYVVAYVVGC